jgi:hypothetical protein
MVYDTRRRVAVLLGGHENTNHTVGDTWEWDGTAWTRLAPSGPSPRFEHEMAYDSGRGATVLFSGPNVGDTWELRAACAADVDGDGALTVQDFLAFLALYAVGDTRADFNASGSIEVADFLAFLAAYAAGC